MNGVTYLWADIRGTDYNKEPDWFAHTCLATNLGKIRPGGGVRTFIWGWSSSLVPENIILYACMRTRACVWLWDASALNQPEKPCKGGKKANKCNLHSILFTKQPHTTPDDKINDGASHRRALPWFKLHWLIWGGRRPCRWGAIINISSVLVCELRPAEGL